jgi:membrane-bound inhibitor of C-type lysozyme
VKTDPELAYLEWPEGYLVLTQIMSGSGARYAAGGAGGELVFWIKSKSAMFERPGQATVDCHIE